MRSRSCNRTQSSLLEVISYGLICKSPQASDWTFKRQKKLYNLHQLCKLKYLIIKFLSFLLKFSQDIIYHFVVNGFWYPFTKTKFFHEMSWNFLLSQSELTLTVEVFEASWDHHWQSNYLEVRLPPQWCVWILEQFLLSH